MWGEENGSEKLFLYKPQTEKPFLDCQTVDPPRHALLHLNLYIYILWECTNLYP